MKVLRRALSALAAPRWAVAPGMDAQLNWSLCKNGIVPKTHAFRNLRTKDLLRGAASIESPAPMQGACTRLSLGGSLPGSLEIDERTFDEVSEAAQEVLSEMPELFVSDAALGAAREGEVRVRAVTDCAASALFIGQMLSKIPLREPTHDAHQIFVLHSAAADPAAEGPYCAVSWTTMPGEEAEAPAEGENAPPATPDRSVGATVVARGAVSLPALASSLASAAAPVLLDQGGKLALPCDVRQGEDGKLTLVFLAPDPMDSSSVGTLEGAHHAVWHAGGVTRMWDGVTTTRLGDSSAPLLHEGGAGATTKLKAASANALPHPARLAFVEDPNGATTKLDATEAIKFFAEPVRFKRVALLGGTDAEIAAFEALLAQSGAVVHKLG